jgi:Tol biopolymer transport system component
MVTAAAVAFACGATAAPASRSSGVALLTYVDTTGGLCGMRADGSHRVGLLSSRRTIYGPTWSADGRYLAFARGTGPEQSKIFVADSRGRVRWHFGHGHINGRPLWSPDGRDLAYVAVWAHVFDLAVARPDGSDDLALAGSPGWPTYGPGDPAWTTDGKRLAFADGNGIEVPQGIYTVSVDGGDRRLLVAHAVQPAFSPDGSKLAYVAINNAFQPDGIYIADADGSRPRPLSRLSTAQTWSPTPTWSPNGTRVAFRRRDAIVVINADGSNERVIASRAASAPVWSPNGKLIAFTRRPTTIVGNRPFTSSIVVAHADGGGERVVLRRRSTITMSVQEPAWRPATALPRAKRLPCAA